MPSQAHAPSKGTSGSNGILATRKAFGTNATPSLDDLVKVHGVWVTVTNAIASGHLNHNSPYGPSDVTETSKSA